MMFLSCVELVEFSQDDGVNILEVPSLMTEKQKSKIKNREQFSTQGIENTQKKMDPGVW